VLGTLIGMFFLALFTPILGQLALKFGAMNSSGSRSSA
jgi:TctA family transporter